MSYPEYWLAFFTTMNLRLRLSFGVVLFAALVLVMALSSLRSLTVVQDGFQQFTAGNGPRLYALSRFDAAVSRLVAEATSFVSNQTLPTRRRAEVGFHDTYEIALRWLDEYDATVPEQDRRPLRDGLRQVFNRGTALIEHSRQGASPDVVSRAVDDLNRAHESIYALLSAATDSEQQSMTQTGARVMDSSQAAVGVVQVAVGMAMVIAALMIVALRRLFVNPIAELMQVAHQMASGNYQQRASVVTADELGALGTTFNSMADAIEKRDRDLTALNQSLEQSYQLRIADLDALHRIGLQLTSSLQLRDVLETILRQTLEMVRGDEGNIFLYDGENLIFAAAFWEGQPRNRPRIFPRKDGFTYRVAQSGQTAVVDNMATHELVRHRGVSGSVIGLPLLLDGVVFGVMNLLFDSPHAFSKHEIHLLELLADHAAIGIQNARLYEQVQRSVLHLEERVEERTAELRLALAKEKQLNELKSRFVSMVSHEFRTPLAIIQAGGDLLRRYSGRMTDAQKNQQLDEIHRQVKQLTELLDDILTVSKAETVGLEFEPAWCSPVELCLGVIEPMRQISTHAIVFSAPSSDQLAWLDSKLVRRALTNLLTNAFKYSPAGSTVTVELEQADGLLTIRVADQGIGIPADDLDRLFEVFHRGRNVGDIAGTGIGLSMVRHSVQAHGGQVQVESTVNLGTTFTLSFPSDRPREPEAAPFTEIEQIEEIAP